VGDAAHFFDPYDSDSIRLAVEQIVNDEGKRQLLIKLGKERLKLFSWRKCAEETLQVYQQLV
jgi:glycosyltransferase involved in cell wall biosynthesis